MGATTSPALHAWFRRREGVGSGRSRGSRSGSNSGCRAQQHRPTTVADSTSLSTEQRATAKPYDATDTLGYWHVRQPRLASACVQTLEGGGAGRPALCAAHAAANLLRSEGWQECPTWAEHRVHAHSTFAIACCCPCTLEPAHEALLLSQSGPQAAAWLTAIPADRSTSLRPEVMQIALRRRLRLPLPLGPRICGQHGHGCRRRLDPWGDHALACTRSGLLARRAKLVEQAWLAVCREAVGAEGHVVPQQWLSHTSAPGVPTSDRRRLDLVVYGTSPQGLALCCDATLVSPITGASAPHPRADHTPGIALRMAESRKRATYPELQRGAGQRLFVLAVEVGGRWNDDSQALVRQLVRVRALRAPPALRAAASQCLDA